MKKVIGKYVYIFMLVIAAICFLRIALAHNAYSAPKSIESTILLLLGLFFVSYSLVTTKIKKDKDKIKKL